MRNAPCNVCGEHLCICAKSLSDDTRHTYQGMTLCSWATAGKHCNMFVSGNQPHCNWHTEWERLLQDELMQGEFDALCVWMQMFEPGGDHGANPGQWWATPEDTIEVCHGFGYLPGRSEKEKYARHLEHWAMMETLKKGIYSEKTKALLARTRGDGLKAKEVLEEHT